MKRIFFLFLICMTSSCHFDRRDAAQDSKIILCIGDGMGREQMIGGSYYLYGEQGRLSFESLPHKWNISTHSSDNAITDSGAAATAIATGIKVNNSVISKGIPGEGENLKTILEYYQALGKKTGMVTTAALSHATPAAFAAHSISRNNYEEIARQYFTESRPDLLLGGGGESYGFSDALASENGYDLIHDEAEMDAYDLAFSSGKLAGFFSDGHMPYEADGMGEAPHLSEMVSFALDYLNNSDNGFFLLVESGRIDHACHNNDIERAVEEVIEFSKTVDEIINWAEGQENVIILVTADHETGGLSVENEGIGNYPRATWTTDYHTDKPVRLYASELPQYYPYEIRDNTDIYQLMQQF